MPLPDGLQPSDFIPDPSNRPNHWLHVLEQTVYSFDLATSNMLKKAFAKAVSLLPTEPIAEDAAERNRAAHTSETGLPASRERLLTAATEADTPTVPEPVTEPHSRAELLDMAASLGLTLPDDMTDEALNQMVLAAIGEAEE